MVLPPEVVHPAGEVEKPQKQALSTAIEVETYAGKIHVEWDPTAAVTPIGQLAFFIEFLNRLFKADLVFLFFFFDLFDDDFLFDCSSNGRFSFRFDHGFGFGGFRFRGRSGDLRAQPRDHGDHAATGRRHQRHFAVDDPAAVVERGHDSGRGGYSDQRYSEQRPGRHG